MGLSGSLVWEHLGKSARFRVGGCCTPYPPHYRAAFAFSPSFTRTPIGSAYARLSLAGGIRAYHVSHVQQDRFRLSLFAGSV